MYRKKSTSIRLTLPRKWKDRGSFLVFIFGGVFLLWCELCHIFPTYYPDNCENKLVEIYTHLFMAVFFAINIYGNMFKLVTTDMSRERFHFFAGSLLPDG